MYLETPPTEKCIKRGQEEKKDYTEREKNKESREKERIMAKVSSFFFFAAAAAALCFLSTLAICHESPNFIIQGRVYCDNCRAGFETTLTKYIEGTYTLH